MPIPVACPGCNQTYQLDDTLRGKKVRCKSCSEVFAVGGQSNAAKVVNEAIQSSARRARQAPDFPACLSRTGK